MALVLLGMAAAGVLLPFSNGASVQAEGQRITLAAKLANDLMEQIVATPRDQIVSAWNGYAESPGQVKDASGVVFTDPIYARYSRQVSCAEVYVPQESGLFASHFLLVRVQTDYQGRTMAKLNRLINK